MKRPTNPWGMSKMPKPKKATAFKQEWRKNLYEAGANKAKALDALRGKACLTFTYHNLPRIVGVFTVGLTQTGRPAMSAWQIDGQSESNTIPDWGLFCFDECFDVALSDRPMPPTPPDYRKGAKQFKFIDAEF